MYKSASKFFQRLKEKHGKDIFGQRKFLGPKPKKNSKGKKKSNNASKSKAVISATSIVNKPKDSSNNKKSTKRSQTLSGLVAKIYGRTERSVSSPKRKLKQEQVKNEPHPLTDVKIIRLKKRG